MDGDKIDYWFGNIAKYRIVRNILNSIDSKNPTTIFDYGAGKGGDWPRVLKDNPNIHLICYEPHQPFFDELSKSLKNYNCQCYSDDSINSLQFCADFIVSFSVLEHCRDRKEYLMNASRLLSKNGVFYLNYDDGHFRKKIDLCSPSERKEAVDLINCWNTNSRKQEVSQDKLYERRVIKKHLDTLLLDIGFKTIDTRYENLEAFKNLVKTVPPNLVEQFHDFWIDVENKLNERYSFNISRKFGDTINLWDCMASCTMTLMHR